MKTNKSPKKSLGQNFLTDPKILQKIADAAQIEKTDTVLEVGPGKGALTEILLKQAAKVVAVEKDSELVLELKEKFIEEIKNQKLEIIEGDILDFADSKEFYSRFARKFSAENFLSPAPVAPTKARSNKILSSNQFKLVGNIPYYITGALFKKFLESEVQPKSITFVIQKEVAERILAKDKKESILSISIKAYGEPEYGGIIKRGSFYPAPKVDSAIISIRKISKENFLNLSEQLFFEILKTGFAHKRKFLIKNMEVVSSKIKLQKAFEKCGIGERARAEDLGVNDWLNLSKNLSD